MFSIIAPLDANRLEQFAKVKPVYDAMEFEKEFLLPTRSFEKVSEYLAEHDLLKDVRLLPYEHERGFNPSKALNLGARNAKYAQLIITSPEVQPKTDVLAQLSKLIGQNVICQVYDQNERGEQIMSLVNESFRKDSPAMYFLAMFNKKDVESINGWDEEFMKGYAYEDNDFGERWNRAGLPFIIRDDIQAIHLYHVRSETIKGGASVNLEHFHSNSDQGVVWCDNGLKML